MVLKDIAINFLAQIKIPQDTSSFRSNAETAGRNKNHLNKDNPEPPRIIDFRVAPGFPVQSSLKGGNGTYPLPIRTTAIDPVDGL